MNRSLLHVLTGFLGSSLDCCFCTCLFFSLYLPAAYLQVGSDVCNDISACTSSPRLRYQLCILVCHLSNTFILSKTEFQIR